MTNFIRHIQKRRSERRWKKLNKKLRKTVDKAIIAHNKVMKATE